MNFDHFLRGADIDSWKKKSIANHASAKYPIFSQKKTRDFTKAFLRCTHVGSVLG